MSRELPKSRTQSFAGIVLISTVALLVLTGCGGSGASTTSPETNGASGQSANPNESSPAAESAQVTPPASGMRSIGQVSVKSPGVEVFTDVSVSEPTTDPASQPNETVLNCGNLNYTSLLATAAWIHGEMTITYQGSIAESVTINNRGVVDLMRGLPNDGLLLFIDPNSGDCRDVSIWAPVMNPNSTLRLEFWVYLNGVRTNAHPNFGLTEARGLLWETVAMGIDQVNNAAAVVNFSGSGAATCGTTSAYDPNSTGLLLYSKAPRKLSNTLTNGFVVSLSCI